MRYHSISIRISGSRRKTRPHHLVTLAGRDERRNGSKRYRLEQ